MILYFTDNMKTFKFAVETRQQTFQELLLISRRK